MANFTRIGYGQVEPNQLSGIKTGQIYASLPLDPNVEVLQQGEFMFYDYAKGMVHGNAEEAIMTEPYMVYQEIKIYEDWLSYKDFAMIRVGDNYVTNRPAIGNLTSANSDGTVYGDGSLTKGVDPSATYKESKEGPSVTLKGHVEYPYRMNGIAPRMLKTNIGDIYTTNMVKTGVEYNVGDILKPAVVEAEAVRIKDKDGEPVKYNTLVLAKDGTIDTVQFAVVKVYTMPDGQPGLKLQRIA